MARRKRAIRALRRIPRRLRPQPNAAAFCATLLIAFHLVVFFAIKDGMPLVVQRLVGLVDATLAMLCVLFITREVRKRAAPPSRRRVNLIGQIAGITVFACVLAWWLSPWAPIRVRAPLAPPPISPGPAAPPAR